jgi:carbon storage regulator
MLVLTRRLGESITIGENVRVVIVDIDGNQVKLGIEAPREISIYREELYQKILKENLEAASIGLEDADFLLEKLTKPEDD